MLAFLSPRVIAASCAILIAIQIAGLALAQEPTAKQGPQMLGTIKESDITESSGLAISGITPDAFWTHNDSGNSAHLFLVATTGKPLARCKLKNAKNRDWEAMCSFDHDGTPWLMVADVGDNSLKRTKLKLYLLPEPKLSAAKSGKKKSKKKKNKKSGEKIESDALVIDFNYPDGAHNVEAAAVTPDGRSVWFIEKIYSNDTRGVQPGIYKMDLNATDFQRRKDKDPPFYSADRLADFPIRNVTGMAFSPDGRRLIVRNYLNAHVFTRPEGRTWAEVVASEKPTPVVMPIQSQGEAICFTRDSKSVLITSEFKRSTIWKVDLPVAENQVK